MTEELQNGHQIKTPKPKRKLRQKKSSEMEDFNLWLGGLDLISAPNLHINGRDYSMAVLTVDFGVPLDEPNKLTSEQTAELVGKMKIVTKSLYKSDVNVRVQNDSTNGVWWTSVN